MLYASPLHQEQEHPYGKEARRDVAVPGMQHSCMESVGKAWGMGEGVKVSHLLPDFLPRDAFSQDYNRFIQWRKRLFCFVLPSQCLALAVFTRSISRPTPILTPLFHSSSVLSC